MILFHILCGVFDMFLLYIFIKELMGEPKIASKALTLLCFIGAEGILTIVSTINYVPFRQAQAIVFLVFGFVFTFLLTLVYEGSFKQRLLVTFSYELCGIFSELIIAIIFSLLPDKLSKIVESSNVYGSFLSKIITMILCLIIILCFKRKHENLSANYTLFVLFMPLISIIAMLAIPFYEKPTAFQTLLNALATSGLLVANIVNYFLLHNILTVNELKQMEENLENQIQYQGKKYQQLSTAYRDTRKLIHDTKKHFFYIKNCVDEEKYDIIPSYLKESIADLENTYISVNSGNLVIDSFVSNYLSIANQEGISFHTDIQITPSSIRISDYDFSIVLGNLLDNALAACRKVTLPRPRIMQVEIKTTSKELIVHIVNSIEERKFEKKAGMERLNHGYGTINIDKITLSYYGVYSHYIEKGMYHAIVSIPFLDL